MKLIHILIFLVMLTSVHALGLNDSLILDYDFETENGPDNYKDLSGGDNNGSYNGMGINETVGCLGTLGKCAEFYGLHSGNDYVVTDAVVDWGDDMTFELWFTTDAEAKDTALIEKSSNKQFIIYEQGIPDASNAYSQTGQGGSWDTSCDFGMRMDGNGWHHIVLVMDITDNTREIFHNGTSLKNCTTTISTSTSDTIMYIGARYHMFNNHNGFYDNVRVWNRKLNASEASELYNDGIGLNNSDLSAVADSTPPVISAVVCTSPDPDDSTEPYATADTTPTFTLTTDESATCQVSDQNSSYTNCGTTGSTSHTCTLPAEDEIGWGTDYVYVNCTDGSSNSKTDQWTMDITEPAVTVKLITPSVDANFTQNAFNTFTVNVTCHYNDCGQVNVSLDPTTVIINSTSGDGHVTSADDYWYLVHDAATGYGTGGTQYEAIAASLHIVPIGYYIHRAFFPFNTTSIPDNATITSADLYFWSRTTVNEDNDGDDFIVVVGNTTQNSTSTLITADFDTCGAVSNPTEMSDRIDIGNINTGATVNIFTLDTDGKNAINIQGVTMFGIREGHDVLNLTIGTDFSNNVYIYTSEEANISVPYLNITYNETAGSGSPSTFKDKGGLIPENSGTYFWVNSSNPVNISLNKDESQLVTWYVNATGNISDVFEFFAWANITIDKSLSNTTDTINITIIEAAAGGDSCTCTNSSVWNLDFSDSCTLSAYCYPSSIVGTNSGLLTITGTLDVDYTVKSGEAVHVKTGGRWV